jgi:membrane-bound lytic murein transglycosylase A
MRLAFAAKSGRPYTSIGGVLEKRGLMTREQLSMQSIRKWMAANPQAARKLMWENESFVFFREVQLERPELGSLGAQHVQLSPERSIAIDRRIWMFGTPIWLETEVPAIPGHTARPFRRLLIAQDTGSAIRGKARGDVFWGSGNRAEAIAGHMKSPGRMVVLLPKMVALFLKAIP